jgi:glucuronoarabinoxylan endo-1,4-beta-xylanase
MLKFVSIVISFVALAALSSRAATATIDTTKTYQTIEGLGGATAFYDGWVTAHPYKLEIYTNAFAGLNLSMLRLGDWYRYNAGFNSASGDGGVAGDIVSNANRVLGHPVPVLISSWSPPAFLKSNGQVGNGGTLVMTNGGFAYTNFAQYWYDSIQAYQSNGVSPTWVSIQNEPDWVAGYDSCVFHPTEDTVNGTNYASYSKALDATFQRLTNLPSPPKLLGPEVVGIGYNDVQNYAATMNANSFYGVAHHLYGGSPDGTPDGYITAMKGVTNVFPTKPKFMTEFGYTNMIQTACLIHDCLTVEQVVGFNYWSLVWPVTQNADGTMNTDGGLIQIENPWNQSTWTNAPPGTPTESHGWWIKPAYWAMKHFSYFINPGYIRVSATDNDNNVRTSAFLSPDNLRLVVVLINTNATVPSAMTLNFGTFSVGASSVYQTAGTNTFQSLGSLTNSQVLPPLSLTTVVLDQTNVSVGAATNPSPADTTSGVALNAMLSWTPGSNALTHALYLGINSNIVAQATTSAPQFQGILTATNFSPSLLSGLTYYWRVDEIAGANTNVGAVWSFSTVAPSANFLLNASDVLNTSSFNTIGNWVTNGTSNAATTPPGPGGAYNTGTFTLRTPTAGNSTFGGASLTLSPGAPATSGSLLLKGPNGASVVINNLIMAGGVLAQGVNSGASGIEWVAGNMNVANNSYVSGLGTTARYIGISANISGSASLSNDCNVVYSGNNIGFTGQMIVGSGGAIQIGAPMNLGGLGTRLVLDNATFQPTASFAINNAGGNVTLNSGGGIFQIGANLTLAISNPVAGPGNLFCYGGGTLQLAGNNSATGSLIASNCTLALIGNATFKNAQLGVSNNATLDVTALTVPLNISNRVVLAGNLLATINKTNFTSLLVASNITYGGTLTLSNLGPALAYGDTIKLFSASNYSGAFSSLVPAAPGTGLIWNTNWISVDGTLFITSTNPALITPPRIANFQLASTNLVVAGTNGNAPGTFFYTLASTNLAQPLANWMIIATNQFGSRGGFIFTNTFDSNNAQQFFILRLP